jgi:hypothetical protein
MVKPAILKTNLPTAYTMSYGQIRDLDDWFEYASHHHWAAAITAIGVTIVLVATLLTWFSLNVAILNAAEQKYQMRWKEKTEKKWQKEERERRRGEREKMRQTWEERQKQRAWRVEQQTKSTAHARVASQWEGKMRPPLVDFATSVSGYQCDGRGDGRGFKGRVGENEIELDVVDLSHIKLTKPTRYRERRPRSFESVAAQQNGRR